MYNPFSLEGKTILVTGASSGIGRGICIDCSKMGAKVHLMARNEERLNETFSKMEGEIQLTFNSNLDYNKYNIPELIFENFHNINSNYYEYYSISSLKKKLNEKATNFINIVNKDFTLLQLNRKIKDKLNGDRNLNLISIYNYSSEYPFPIPNESYLLLFINKTCDDFIYYYKKENKFYGGLVLAEQNDKIAPFFLSDYINKKESNFLIYKF